MKSKDSLPKDYLQRIHEELIKNPNASDRKISKLVNNGKTDYGKRITIKHMRSLIS